MDAQSVIFKEKITFCVLYRPPPSASNNFTNTMFQQDIADLFENLTVNTGHLCIVGDFNSHLDNKNRTETKSFADLDFTEKKCTFYHEPINMLLNAI